MTTRESPEFGRFLGPILDALRKLGGSATPQQVTDVLAHELGVSQRAMDEALPSGKSRVKNQIHWARFYLVRAGLLDSPSRGVWSLTGKGRDTQLDEARTSALVRDLQRQISYARRGRKAKVRVAP